MVAVTSDYAPFVLMTPVAGATDLVINPTLQIYLLVPSTNPARQQWALLIMNRMLELGIQAQRVIVDWDTIYARALLPNAGVAGKTYAYGGFDALFSGSTLTLDADPYQFCHSSQFPLSGKNYYLWNNTENDELLEKIRGETNETKRLDYLKQWQVLAYDELPSIAIFYSKDIVLMDPHINSTPFEKYYYLWPNVELWQFNDSTSSATLAQSGPLASLSLLHSSTLVPSYQSPSYCDLGFSAPVYGEGAGYGLMMTGYDYRITDYMAHNNWTVTPDGRNWTFWVRPGILFHNGEEMDARDVVATQRAVMAPAFVSPTYSLVKSILGSNTSIYFAGEADTPGADLAYNKYEVHFDLPSASGLFLEKIAPRSIYPASVLLNGTYDFTGQDYIAMQAAADTLANFRLTSFGAPTDVPYLYTMKNGSASAYIGPIGAGPYTYDSYDSASKTVHLQKNPNYFRGSALEAQGYLQLADYYSRYIADRDEARASLQAGEVDVLEAQYHFDNWQRLEPIVDRSWGIWISHDGLEVQELGFNMRHPIFGTGLGTPLGLADPSRAAEAAKHVRRAIEYLVPKHDIIMILMNTIASYGITMPVTRAMAGFNNDIVPRNDTVNSQTPAMDELRAAGYTFSPPDWPIIEPPNLLVYGIFVAVAAVLIASLAFWRIRKNRTDQRNKIV